MEAYDTNDSHKLLTWENNRPLFEATRRVLYCVEREVC